MLNHKNRRLSIDFLTQFDGRTAALLVAIAFFIQASAIGAQSVLIKEYKGVRTALLGNLSLAFGFSLFLFRGVLPDFITIVLANTLNTLCPNLFYIAISRFTGNKANLPLVTSIIALNAILLSYFTYIDPNVNLRIIIVSFTGAFSTFVLARQLWKARHERYRFSVWLAITPFVIYGTFLIFRTIATIFSPPNQIFAQTPVELATYLLLFIISFLWTVGFIIMISQRLQVDLTDFATTDSLTRIPNRHATQIFFQKELSRIERYGGEFSILLIDLDDFKKINDTFGHAMGDTALVQLAGIFQSVIRKQDIVGRWGGEEFLMILPSTSMENAYALAERIRKIIVEIDLKPLHLTISVGIAHATGTQSVDTILKKADDALYVAKATKNTVVQAR